MKRKLSQKIFFKTVLDNIVPLVLLLVSLVIIAPYCRPGIIIGSGESALAINPFSINPFSTWNEHKNLGSFFGGQSAIYLFYFFWKILSLFSWLVHPSIIFIFLSFFLPGLFLYFLLVSNFENQNKLVYLPPCLLYSFNIYRVTISYLNENISLFFIFMPLFFLFYQKLLDKKEWKYVFILTLISLLSSTLGNNMAVFLIPYFLLGLYFVYYLLSHRNLEMKKLIILNVVLILLVLAGNLFWLSPLLQALLQSYQGTVEEIQKYDFTGAGTFLEHLRFMGFWAWRSGYAYDYYFPFFASYDKVLLLVTTSFIALLSFVYLIFLKSEKSKNLKIFFTILAVISYFMVVGNKGPTGIVYRYLYNHLPFFKMYREPYAKFMPLFIFASVLGLNFSLSYMVKFFKSSLARNIFIGLTSFIILVNVYPLFTKEAIRFRRWNLYQQGHVLKVPKYWESAADYLGKSKLDEQFFLLPYNFYSTSHNLEYGINVVGNLADYLMSNKLIRGWEHDKSDSGKIIRSLFETKEADWQRYLGLLGAKKVLVENDVEWRYSEGRIFSPSVTEKLMLSQGFKKLANFGLFNIQYLSRIPNGDPVELSRQWFYQELMGKPALVLYRSDSQNFLPHFYISKKIVFSEEKIEELVKIVSNPNYEIRTAVYFSSQVGNSQELLKLDVNDASILEFKKINPTKYRVVVHNVRGIFPLVFNETYHKDWKLYLKNLSTFNPSPNVDFLNKNYRIFDGNEEDQASKGEVVEFIGKGWLTTLGDLREDRIDFISKNFQNSIQNDNLPEGKLFETWLSSKVAQVPDKNHLIANGYANSWIIDAEEICQQTSFCRKNDDGSYDFEVVAEFYPQRLFFLEFGVSSLIFLAITVYLAYHHIERKNQQRY